MTSTYVLRAYRREATTHLGPSLNTPRRTLCGFTLHRYVGWMTHSPTETVTCQRCLNLMVDNHASL